MTIERSPASRLRTWAVPLLLGLPTLLVVYGILTRAPVPSPDASPPVTELAQSALDDEEARLVGVALARAWHGDPGPAPDVTRWHEKNQSIYVAARARGARLGHAWGDGADLGAAIARALAKLADTPDRDRVDTLIVSLAHSYRDFDLPKQRRALTANVYRGIRGIEITYKGKVTRFAPTQMVAGNRSIERTLEVFAKEHDTSVESLFASARIRSFEADQLFVPLSDPTQTVAMLRGNRVVPSSAVTREGTQELIDDLTLWLTQNLHDDGRITYHYFPSTGEEAKGNNMIRQWMATIALEKVATRTGDAELWKRIAGNIEYDLAKFYREIPADTGEGTWGTINYGGKVKLGAMSLACLSLVLHPDRERWSRVEQALRTTITAMQREDGRFTTFLRPKDYPDKGGSHNFYPGETLLLWAHLYREDPTPEALERYMRSFRHYRQWHLSPRNRKPSFVPWHTQADFMMWEATQDEELADFVFEMNDWLVAEMAQWDGLPYPDLQGRFYSASQPFGPPHASSTGVYLEGLIDAYELARAKSDTERQERYRLAMLRGIRSVMQLTFHDDVDMFYVPDAERHWVHGGVRTTVYDNRIRCDNVQHNLMGLLKIIDGIPESGFHL